MSKDGKRLEELVAYVERELVPEGFTVQNNRKVYDSDGNQLAEFDIEVRGELGTTEIGWLIECRDRPSEGPAPASWIEQLGTRRGRFKLSNITAVSTTGFSKPAIALAESLGIELRELKELTPEAFSHWLKLEHLTVCKSCVVLEGATLFPVKDECNDRIEALTEAIKNFPIATPLLLPADSDVAVQIVKVMERIIAFKPEVVGDVRVNDPPKPLKLKLSFLDPSGRYSVSTKLGRVPIGSMQLSGTFALTETKVPITQTKQYGKLGSGNPISQIAAFEFEVDNRKITVEMRRLEKTGETHVIVIPGRDGPKNS